MKVTHVNVSDNKGGAARAALRLHQGLRQAGIDSSMVVTEKYSADKQIIVPVHDRMGYFERRLHYRQLSARFWRYFSTRPDGFDPFTHLSTPRNHSLVEQLPNTDIINLHWIANFVDLPTFFAKTPVPIVWTLHDMNAFTGGCHYTLGCEKYQNSCGVCPQLGSNASWDISRQIWLEKQAQYRLLLDGKLHIVTPSCWLAEEARQSPLLGQMPITVIPNGLNTTVFQPQDQIEAREKLGIPVASKVLLFSADSIVSRRKGLQYLINALQDIDGQTGIMLVSLGAGKIAKEPKLPMINLGHLTDAAQIALAYSAADLFVIPSLQDNLPNTVLEALACGTPVVGFDVGGISDMVRPGITGELVPVKDIRQLRESILALINNPHKRAEMASNCRQIAVTEYSLHVQAMHYIQLYQHLLHQESTS